MTEVRAPIAWVFIAAGLALYFLMGLAEQYGVAIAGNAMVVLIYALGGRTVVGGVFVGLGLLMMLGNVSKPKSDDSRTR